MLLGIGLGSTISAQWNEGLRGGTRHELLTSGFHTTQSRCLILVSRYADMQLPNARHAGFYLHKVPGSQLAISCMADITECSNFSFQCYSRVTIASELPTSPFL